MLTDDGYLEAKCAPAISASHSVTHEFDHTVIQVVREMALPSNIPDIARTIVGNTLKLTETQTWTNSDERTAKLSIVVIAGTAEINGTMTLVADGDETKLSITAEIMVRVPIFGASLERSIVGTVESVLNSEQAIGQNWLDHNAA